MPVGKSQSWLFSWEEETQYSQAGLPGATAAHGQSGCANKVPSQWKLSLCVTVDSTAQILDFSDHFWTVPV